MHLCLSISDGHPSKLFPQKKLEGLLHKAILQVPPSLSACARRDSNSAVSLIAMSFLFPSLCTFGLPILSPNSLCVLYGSTPPAVSSLRLSSTWLARLLAKILHSRENSMTTTSDLVSFKGILSFCIQRSFCTRHLHSCFATFSCHSASYKWLKLQ